MAGELQAKLENLGYKVFLDVDEIGSGQFPSQIESAIKECKDFLLVLSPGTFDRCVDEEDWVRREIVMAHDLNKNIIGVGLPGFVMPDEEGLPAALAFLPTSQVFPWTHEYRKASFQRVEENLVSFGLKKKRRRAKWLALCAVVLVLAVVVLVPLMHKPDTASIGDKASDNAQSQLFEYHSIKALNLSQDLPDTLEFRENFLQMVADKQLFGYLMQGIAECDSALMLKNQAGSSIVDQYDIDAKRKDLLALRKGYLDIIMADVKLLLDEGAMSFARQDLEVARLLASPDESPRIDSLESIIKLSQKE